MSELITVVAEHHSSGGKGDRMIIDQARTWTYCFSATRANPGHDLSSPIAFMYW